MPHPMVVMTPIEGNRQVMELTSTASWDRDAPPVVDRASSQDVDVDMNVSYE